MKDLNYYMGLNYRTEILRDDEDGGYVLSCPELPGCVTCADTVEEGLSLLSDAKRCWLSACIEDGAPIPEPVPLDDYSGQFKLRLPKSLHRRLARQSKEEGVSMNQYCLYLLSKGVSAR